MGCYLFDAQIDVSRWRRLSLSLAAMSTSPRGGHGGAHRAGAVHPSADRRNNAAETTGKFVVAKFEHDTARPVDGYAAPQLYNHAVVFNMTERENGKLARYRSAAYLTHSSSPLQSINLS